MSILDHLDAVAGLGALDLLVLGFAALGSAPWWPPRRLSHVRLHRDLAEGGGIRRARSRAGRGPSSRSRPVDAAVLIDLAGAALAAGSSIPGTLEALGEALCGHDHGRGHSTGTVPNRPIPRQPACRDAVALAHAGSALVRGSPWVQSWSGAPERLSPLQRALEPAWADGVAVEPLLRRAADEVRAGQAQAADEAAARLGVRLVLPLGLCFLPSFVLLGLVPVFVAAGVGLVG